MYYQYFTDTNPTQVIDAKYFTPKIPRGEGGTPYACCLGASRTNASALLAQSASIAPANPLPDSSRCISIRPRRPFCASESTAPNASGARNSAWYLWPRTKDPSASCTQANPPVIP